MYVSSNGKKVNKRSSSKQQKEIAVFQTKRQKIDCLIQTQEISMIARNSERLCKLSVDVV